MKYVFACISVILVLASFALYASFPDTRSDVPVIYWVTDNNPARQQQVALFHQWLIKQGYGTRVRATTLAEARALRDRQLATPLIQAMRLTTPDATKLWSGAGEPLEVTEADLPLEVMIPLTELRTDNANADLTKQVIQGVSGVGGDVVDSNGLRLPYLHALGLLTDVTDWGRDMGFSVDRTYPAIVPDITVADYTAEGSTRNQYAFPCNVYAQMMWVNKDTFAKLGVPLPPERWTLEEFESLGKQFVAAANQPGERQTVFFCMGVDKEELARSMGLSIYNETGTRCTVDDERFMRVLELIHKWTYTDRILPSAADKASFDTQSGYGNAVLQLFNSGKIGVFRMGRYALIQLRRFGELDMAVVEPPHGGFPTTITGTRCAYVYVGGEPELAKYFLSYLASEDYNMQIVRDADALPPNPAYTRIPEFTHPPEHPNEWGLHEKFSNAVEEIAIGRVYSPFVLQSVATRLLADAESAVMANRLTPEQAARQAARLINQEMERTLREEPKLRPVYERLVKQQEQIDRLRAEGRKVPLHLIENTFYQRYYAAQGWLEESESAVAEPVSGVPATTQ